MQKEIVTCDRCYADCTGKVAVLRITGMTRRDLCGNCVEYMIGQLYQRTVQVGTQTSPKPALDMLRRIREELADMHTRWQTGASAEELRQGILHLMNLAAELGQRL